MVRLFIHIHTHTRHSEYCHRYLCLFIFLFSNCVDIHESIFSSKLLSTMLFPLCLFIYYNNAINGRNIHQSQYPQWMFYPQSHSHHFVIYQPKTKKRFLHKPQSIFSLAKVPNALIFSFPFWCKLAWKRSNCFEAAILSIKILALPGSQRFR